MTKPSTCFYCSLFQRSKSKPEHLLDAEVFESFTLCAAGCQDTHLTDSSTVAVAFIPTISRWSLRFHNDLANSRFSFLSNTICFRWHKCMYNGTFHKLQFSISYIPPIADSIIPKYFYFPT
jgi:hypothetical protein